MFQGLNPLKRVNSILTEAVEELGLFTGKGLNPLKRVNSILTFLSLVLSLMIMVMSQSPQAGQFNSYNFVKTKAAFWFSSVSIPSSGSIQFLHY